MVASMTRRLRDFLKEIKLVEKLSSPFRNGTQGILGDMNGKARLIGNKLVDAFEKGTSSGEDNAPVDQVGGEFGRATFEGHSDRVDDDPEGIHEGLPDFGGGDLDRFG